MKKLIRQLAVILGLALVTAPQIQAALITSAADPALAGASLIDFDSEATGNFASKTISGVTFTVASGGTLRNAHYTEGGVFGGSGQDLSTVNTTGASAFDIDFTGTVSAFGFVWGAANYVWSMDLFDSSNVLIESLMLPAGPPFVIYGGASNVGIARVELKSTGSHDWVKIDDFKFVTSSTSVPDTASTLGLLAIGIACMGWVRSRRA